MICHGYGTAFFACTVIAPVAFTSAPSPMKARASFSNAAITPAPPMAVPVEVVLALALALTLVVTVASTSMLPCDLTIAPGAIEAWAVL